MNRSLQLSHSWTCLGLLRLVSLVACKCNNPRQGHETGCRTWVVGCVGTQDESKHSSDHTYTTHRGQGNRLCVCVHRSLRPHPWTCLGLLSLPIISSVVCNCNKPRQGHDRGCRMWCVWTVEVPGGFGTQTQARHAGHDDHHVQR